MTIIDRKREKNLLLLCGRCISSLSALCLCVKRKEVKVKKDDDVDDTMLSSTCITKSSSSLLVSFSLCGGMMMGCVCDCKREGPCFSVI